MLRLMYKSKTHGATVTETQLQYAGSITIPADLMETADLLRDERLQVVNLSTGSRIETYVIQGPPARRSSATACTFSHAP